MKKIVNIVLSLITVVQLSAQSLDSVDFKLENITDSLYLLAGIPNPSSGNKIIVDSDELKKRDVDSDSIMERNGVIYIQ